MKTHALAALLLLSLAGSLFAGDAKIEQALRDLDAQWSKDAGAKDADKTVSYYAESALVQEYLVWAGRYVIPMREPRYEDGSHRRRWTSKDSDLAPALFDGLKDELHVAATSKA